MKPVGTAKLLANELLIIQIADFDFYVSRISIENLLNGSETQAQITMTEKDYNEFNPEPQQQEPHPTILSPSMPYTPIIPYIPQTKKQPTKNQSAIKRLNQIERILGF